MHRFIALYLALDATTRTGAKQQALEGYFRSAEPQDAAWAAYFLTGRRLKRLVKARDLRDAALEASGVPGWLFASCHEATGDLAETIALLLPPRTEDDARTLSQWVDDELAPLAGLAPEAVRERLGNAWRRLDSDGRFVHVKLITGAFRVGVAKQLVVRALAGATGIPVTDVAQRLAGDWSPSAAFFARLQGSEDYEGRQLHRPYPFFLAHTLDGNPAALGPIGNWLAEWKWDGIRAQIIVRGGNASIWSRGDELVNDAFPELVEAALSLPDGTVVDGEVLAWNEADSTPYPFATLQRRLNRKTPGARLLRETPLVLCAYDVLEHESIDIRALPLIERRARLASLIGVHPKLRLSTPIDATGWSDLAAARAIARDVRAEGVMLKRRDSGYGVGRVRGEWWKWKVDPFTVDAVLVYAEPGSGRRASLFTDYTFAVWQGDALVPFAKAYSGLTDEEIRRVDGWVRAHTIERFGPVRRVEPSLVFELAFEGLQVSPRHKSGVAVRFPRIARWRTDKPAGQADTLETLKRLAMPPGPRGPG